MPFGQALAWTDGDGTRGPGPLADGSPWTDPLDDLTNVYVPPGGLVGVEVSGGDVHLLAGSDDGWIASSVIQSPDDYRYDLVLLEVDTPGDSWVNVTILDPSRAPTSTAFANATVPGFVNLTGNDVSVFRVPVATYPEVRIQVNMHANGTDRPRLLSWSMQFIELGLWRDDFLGAGKMLEHDGIEIAGGDVRVDLTSGEAGASDPYPTVVFPDARSTVDVFYANSAGDGYDDSETIQLTAGTRGGDVGDLDGDGLLDLVLAMNGNTGSAIFWGQQSGEWTNNDMQTFSHTDEGTDAAVGDFNGDGELDFVISAVGGMVNDGSYVWLNQGSGTFNKAHDIKLAGATRSVAAGDLNGDGYDDIVLTKSLVMDAPCYFGSATGPDTAVDINFLQGISMTAIGDVHIDDIDGDGHLDVLFAVIDNKKAPVYLGSASGPDTTSDYDLSLKGLPTGVSTGDINDDGYTDIVYVTYDGSAGTTPRLEMFEGTSRGWSDSDKHEVLTQGAVTGPVEVLDIDADGYDDIAMGDQSDFMVFKGGSSWPTAASITKSGLLAPEDMVVAVSRGGPSTFSGHFVSESIPIPDGMVWDVLYLDADVPEGTEVTITVLDSGMDPLTAYTGLPGPAIDLSGVGPWRSIHVRVDLKSTNNTTTPTLRSLLVNWHPENVWRDQFFGDIKAESMLNMEVPGLALSTSSSVSSAPALVYAGLRSNNLYDVRSLAFTDAGSLDYLSRAPLEFTTTGAMAVDDGDVNGDLVPDLAFASYGSSPSNRVGESPVFLGSHAGWYGAPYHTFSTIAATDIAMDDLDGDGYADVVIAQDLNGALANPSLLFWGGEDGWAATPDVEFDTTGAFALDAVDLDDDDLVDLVFACENGDSLLFYQESTGFCGTVPSHRFSTEGPRGIAHGDLDGDGNTDLVFANYYDGSSFLIDSQVYWGQTGRGWKANPTELATTGAMDVAVADVDGDSYLDVVFANNRNASSGYVTHAGIYINDGSGGLATTPLHSITTDGAYAVTVLDLDGAGVKDLVFACKSNATGHRIPSMGFVSPTATWTSEPNVLFPTAGAADVLPVALAGPNIVGYLSEAITPDPSYDAEGFDTLTCEVGQMEYGPFAQILDAVTGEALTGRHQLGGGYRTWDVRDLFSYRDHPSIRILIGSNRDPAVEPFSVDDLTINWTKRVPLAPQVVDISISNTTVHRADTVTITVEASDEFDLPGEMAYVLEHRLDGETQWKTYLIGDKAFEDGLWKVTIAPDRFVPLGTYTFRVNVTDTDGLFSGFVELEETLEVLANLPEAPNLISATPGDGEVELEWRAPHDTGDLPLDGYRILRGDAEDDLSVVATVDSFADGHRDTGLVNGQTYYYAVLGYNDLGDSPWSQVLNATPLGPPGIPLDLKATPGDESVTLTWTAPEMEGGSPILGYRVLRGTTPANMVEVAPLGVVTEYLDEGLTNGQE